MNSKNNIGEVYFYLLMILLPFLATFINRNIFAQLFFLLIGILFLLVNKGYINFHHLKKNILLFSIYALGIIYLFSYKTGYFEYFIKEFLAINLLIFLYWVFNTYFTNQ